jgi:hypothetical protein
VTIIHFPEEEEFRFVESYIVIDKITCDPKPFGDLSAENYFEFAKSALARGDKASLVDALSNAKRCFDYQVNRLLYRYGLMSATTRRDFPSKVKLLSKLNIIPSTLLQIYNKERNQMEHEFITPDKEAAEGAIDLCDLLFLATERYLKDTPARIRIKLRNDDRDLMFLLEPGGTRIEFYQIFGSEIVEVQAGKFYGTSLHIPKETRDSWLNDELKITRLQVEDIELKPENETKWLPYIRLISAQVRDRRETNVAPSETMVTVSTTVLWEAVKSSFEKAWQKGPKTSNLQAD